MSDENFHSLSRTPPTPGKHLFIPPPPILASSFSSSSSSSFSSHSHTKQDHVNLPLKKRKEIVSISEQVRVNNFFCSDLIFCKFYWLAHALIIWSFSCITPLQAVFILGTEKLQPFNFMHALLKSTLISSFFALSFSYSILYAHPLFSLVLISFVFHLSYFLLCDKDFQQAAFDLPNSCTLHTLGLLWHAIYFIDT